MRVSISVPGTFHAFDLATQLYRREALDTIYTTYPRFKLNHDLPTDYVEPIRHAEFVMQLGVRIPALNRLVPSKWNRSFRRWKGTLFDRSVSRRLSADDDGLFLGFAGSCRQSLERAEELNMTTAVERSSSHIRTQWEILSREYQRHGAVSPPLSEDAVDYEEQEYETADYIVTPSEFAYQSFLDRGFDEESVKCIPFGVDPPSTTSVSRNSETVRFLFAGNVSIRKGIPYLLEAWDNVDLPDAELAIASKVDKNVRPLLTDYEERDDVRLLGWVDDLQDWFDRSSVFVFPSLEEGSAIVTYEAMAAGLPLITTFNSGWVGEDGVHGIEVTAADSESLAEALRKLYDNPSKRRRMGKEAETLIRENYTLDDYGERVYRAYQSMIGSN